MRLITIFMGLILATAFANASVQVDLDKSSFRWTGKKKLISNDSHTGLIKLKSAEVTASDDGKIKAGTLVMDMTTINVTDLSGGQKKRFDGHMKSADFFDVANYPTATLNITKVSGQTATGTLQMKDSKPQPVTVKFKKRGSMYKGTFVFDRTKFGVKYGSRNFFKKLADEKVIDNMVTVEFQVHVTPKSKKASKKS